MSLFHSKLLCEKLEIGINDIGKFVINFFYTPIKFLNSYMIGYCLSINTNFAYYNEYWVLIIMK